MNGTALDTAASGASATSGGATVTPGRLRLKPPPAWHRVAEGLLRFLALSAIGAIILIFVFVAKEALPLFYDHEVRSEVTPGRMFFAHQWEGYDAPEHVWQPVSDVPKYALLPLIVGTIKVSLVAMLFGVPLAVAGALYVSQYARHRTREIVKPIIEMLASIPSVVLGFFALMVMASLFQDWFGFESRLNAVVAGVALSFAVIPIVFTISEEAFGAVPRSYVEASTALGALKWQTVLKVIVPAASPGVAAGIALGLGRAVGETMIVLMASGNASTLEWTFTESVRTLPATIAAEMGEAVEGGAHYTVLFFIGTLLFLTTAAINFLGDFAIQRMKRKMGVA